MNERIDLQRLSRALSFALRHAPEAFGLVLDAEGYVDVHALLRALRFKYPEWFAIEERDLVAVAALPEHERFEISGAKMRALYGHSASVELERTPTPPPPVLYHATAQELLTVILAEGLRPMRRSHVHLSTDTTYARSAAKTLGRPALVAVDAAEAHRRGVRFYQASEIVWLSEAVPPECVSAALDEPSGPSPEVQRERIRELFRTLTDE